MRLRKWMTFGLSAAMVAVSLTGCGSSTGTKETTANKAGTETTANAAPLDAKLLVWGPAEDQAEENGAWLQTMCEEFNAENPQWNITFEYGVCSEGDAAKVVTQDPSASADVYFFANDQLGTLISANAISKLGGETADYVKDTNSAAIVDSVTVDGGIYGVPFTTNTWFMYYDKSKFTEEDVKSLDVMMEKERVAFPLSNSWYLASFFVANGCTLFGDGTDEAAGIDFGGDKAVAVTNYLVDMAANPNFVDDNSGAGIAGLRDGSIAAMFSGSWDYMSVKEALGDNFGAKELPTINIDGQEKQLRSFAGSKAVAINPNCKDPQIAVALVRYLTNVRAQQTHYELRSVVPCHTGLLETATAQGDILVIAQNATFDNTSILQPFVAKMGNYWTPAENFGKSILSGEVTRANAAEKTEEFNTSLNTSIQ